MIPYNVPINAKRMTIGVQGENNVREFLFDVTEWRQLTGDIGTAEMVIQRRGDSSPYAAAITMHDENTVSWIPVSADTAKAGAGKIQLMWIADGQTVKTKIFDMKVDPALDYQLPDDSLDPWASWVPDVINAAAAMGDLPGTVADATAEWLEENIGPTTPAIDKTLLVEGAGADAKKTGEEISYLKNELKNEVFEQGQSFLHTEFGNFTGSNISTNISNTSKTILRTDVLENVGPCLFRTKIPGLRLVIYTTDTLPTHQWNIFNNDVIYVPKNYNYARIRIQQGASGLADFTGINLETVLVKEEINSFNEQQKASEILNYQINGIPVDIIWNVDKRVTVAGVVEEYTGTCCSDLIEYNNNYILSLSLMNTSITETSGYLVFYDSSNNVIDTIAQWRDFYNAYRTDGYVKLSAYSKYNPASFRICKRINVHSSSRSEVTGQQLVDLFNSVKLYNNYMSYPRLPRAEIGDNNILYSVAGQQLLDDTHYTFTIEKIQYNKPLMVDISSSFSGTLSNEYNYPTISATTYPGAFNARIPIGSPGNLKNQQIRLYPVTLGRNGDVDILIHVPSGLSLNIEHLTVAYDTNTTKFTSGINICMHTHQPSVPRFSKYSVQLIENTGGTYCIELPKRSSDGVWFCYHDDTFNISDTFLRNLNGSIITDTTYNGLPFSQIPFNYLASLDWGIYLGSQYAGTGPLLIEDFFKMCATTGMHPCLSFHPVAQSTEANFTEIKNLAKKYNVLHLLNVKIPVVIDPTLYPVRRALTVFGYDIESYTVNVPIGQDVQTVIDATDEAFSNAGIDKSKVKCVIERFAYDPSSETNDTQLILNAEYYAGIAQVNHIDPTGYTTILSGADIKYHVNRGVTYFTTINFSTIGTNWW